MTTTRNKSKSSKVQQLNPMARLGLFFSFILLWCFVSTDLLVRLFQSNNELHRQLQAHGEGHSLQVPPPKKTRKKKKNTDDELATKFVNSKNLMGKRPKARKTEETQEEKDVPAAEHKHKEAKQEQIEERSLLSTATANQFPFTRSLETFKRSQNFFIYVVQGVSPDSNTAAVEGATPLEWSEISWKDLAIHWGRNTTFNDVLRMSTPLHSKEKSNEGSMNMNRKLVLHCLPKAASTTLRRACYKNMKDSCTAMDFPTQQDPYGYRKIDDFFQAVKECGDTVNHYCVQGGDAQMSIINYEEDTSDRDPIHFVHMVPHRKFDDWVASAIKQIYVIDGNCDRINKLLDHGCLGYRELYMELYPKSVLSLLIGMAFEANSKALSSRDKHHIVLYNYKDVDNIVTEVSDFFGMDPLPHTNMNRKGQRAEGTCPAIISEKFHDCHDETLMNADAIRGMKAELRRRSTNDREMKRIMMCMRNDDCNKYDEEAEEN